jgi:hypothetical protein
MHTSVRKVIDCREFPSESKCSLTISGTEAEVLKAATEHAVSSHGHAPGPTRFVLRCATRSNGRTAIGRYAT